MRVKAWTFIVKGAGLVLGVGMSCPQSERCVQFVDCVAYADPLLSRAPTPTLNHAEGGRCWQWAEEAERCTEHCAEQIAATESALLEANLDVGPCYATTAPNFRSAPSTTGE